MKWCLDGDPSAAGVYGARPSVAPTCIGGKVNLATARPSLQYRRDQEIIAEEIEDPFGKDENDLPMARLTTMIDGNVKEILA